MSILSYRCCMQKDLTITLLSIYLVHESYLQCSLSLRVVEDARYRGVLYSNLLSKTLQYQTSDQIPMPHFQWCDKPWKKKEEIWLSPMTKAPTPPEKPKKQHDNTQMPPKTSITQWLRTDLGRSVGVSIAGLRDPNLPTNRKSCLLLFTCWLSPNS